MRKTQAALLIRETGSQNIETWLKHIATTLTTQDLEQIRHAFMLAQLTGEGHATPNGLSCLQQGLVMAEILAELNVDTDTLMAAIVYNNVRFADLNTEDITEQLGKSVTKLIEGTIQMDASHVLHDSLHTTPTSIDNLRKMLLAMVSDIRVILIKLAERLCILRNMPLYSQSEKHREACLTMDIYAPLANRLGIGHMKWELEDLAFRYISPKSYKEISKSLKMSRDKREEYVQKVIKNLKQSIKELGIKKTEITGRVKHIYGIYRKMQRKHVPISEIYDTTAFRILVPTIEDCYAALSHIHSQWKNIPKEFDDYIAQPKHNGYRSIHTAVIGPNNVPIEIQIRTFEMHEQAELGMAAHWLYKEGATVTLSKYQEKITLLRQVMDWQKDMTKQEPDAHEVQEHIFNDRVYVFTPNGEIVDLPKGATPLDFAYHIHSEIGNHCRGGKINGKLVPLTYKLNTGERVEILTTKRGQPSRDWLNPHLGYLATGRAKAKVHSWFRKLDYEHNLEEGQAILEKEEKRLNLKNINYQGIAEKINYKSTSDMLAGLGRGDIRISNVINAIQSTLKPPEPQIPESFEVPTKIKKKQQPTEIEIQGVGNLLTQIANCCKPIPGDSIIGYVTIGRGISIHRKDCPNILHNKKLNINKLIEVNWGEETREKYAVDLIVDAYNRQGLARDITNLLAQEKISIIGLTLTTEHKRHTAHINLSIEIHALSQLSQVISRIQQLNNVTEVKRSEQ